MNHLVLGVVVVVMGLEAEGKAQVVVVMG